MKRILVSAVLLCAVCGLSVLAEQTPSNQGKRPESPATRPTTQPVAINKFCAVDSDNPVDSTVATVVYEGKVIGFCCEDCIPKFKKNPKLYMKDLK